MKMHQAIIFSTMGVLLTGCTLREVTYSHSERPRGYYDDRVVIVDGPPPPRDVVVVQEPVASPVYVIRREPPPPRVEVIPPRPRGDVVWVKGYWMVDRDRWVWVSGRYVSPPRRDAVWVEPRWDHHDDGFHFTLGFWK